MHSWDVVRAFSLLSGELSHGGARLIECVRLSWLSGRRVNGLSIGREQRNQDGRQRIFQNTMTTSESRLIGPFLASPSQKE